MLYNFRVDGKVKLQIADRAVIAAMFDMLQFDLMERGWKVNGTHDDQAIIAKEPKNNKYVGFSWESAQEEKLTTWHMADVEFVEDEDFDPVPPYIGNYPSLVRFVVPDIEVYELCDSDSPFTPEWEEIDLWGQF